MQETSESVGRGLFTEIVIFRILKEEESESQISIIQIVRFRGINLSRQPNADGGTQQECSVQT